MKETPFSLPFLKRRGSDSLLEVKIGAEASDSTRKAGAILAVVEPPALTGEVDVDGELASVVMACLCKDPGGRPRDLLAALQRVGPSAWTPEMADAFWDDVEPAPEAVAGAGGDTWSPDAP